jgi:NitT/TauT family transport system substrate-binding protein
MRTLLKSYAMTTMVTALLAALGSMPAGAAEKMKVTLNWLPDNGSIGIIYADVLGYYKDAGIDLEIEPGKGSGSTSQLVAGGSTDVGLASASSAIGIAAKGAPLKVIAPIYAVVDWGITSLKDTPITKPKDLEGKTIALQPGAADIPLFDSMLQQNGVDKSKVNIQTVSGAGVVSLLAEKQIDGVSAAPGDVMIPLAKQMFYKDWGAPLVGISLIARADKLEQNPELYKKFVDATLKGYSEVAKHPSAAVDALRERYPDAAPKEELMEELTKFDIPLFCTAGAPGIGAVPVATWTKTGEILTATFGSLGDGGIGAMHTESYLPVQLPACP